MQDRIAVTLLTGFLGSGKTTLLNRLLHDPLLADTAVIINEFGEIGIDHLLVERADEDIVELTSGCLCCTMRGDLVDTLNNLVEKTRSGEIQKLKRVIIETTGLADPAPIVQIFLAHPLVWQFYALSGIITTIDAFHCLATLEEFAEARKQVIFADQLILTKIDLIQRDEKFDQLMKKLRLYNQNAKILPSFELKAGDFIACDLFNLSNKDAALQQWLALEDPLDGEHKVLDGDYIAIIDPQGRRKILGSNHADNEITLKDHDRHRRIHKAAHNHAHHEESVLSFALTFDKPVPCSAIDGFIDALKIQFGERILRMKGLVAIVEDIDHPLVLHGVQGQYHPPMLLQEWPNKHLQTRLVIIGQNICKDQVESLFRSFFNLPMIDTADRQAMMDNPLVIPGLKF